MDPIQELLGNNCIEDVSWLCSLSDSDLDMLISLKALVLRRAKVIGHEELAKNFNFKILRALALVLMEHAKENIKNSSHVPDLAKCDALMDSCGLLQCKLADVLSIEELQTCIGNDRKKRSKSTSARFLWKSVPSVVKENEPEVVKTWRMLVHMRQSVVLIGVKK